MAIRKITERASNPIKDALIAEAVERARKSDLKGDNLMEYIKKVGEDLSLSEEETKEVASEVINPTNTDLPNCIWFDSEEEAEDATGLLMYSKIAWESRGETDDFFYIQFDNSDVLNKAYKILKNKWDLVDYTQRVVGFIQFDNLADYLKVLDFIKQQDMVVQFGSTDAGIGEDYDLEVSPNPKNIKEATLASHQGSYVAVPHSKTFEHKAEPYTSKQDRIASVRKTWK